MSIARSTLSLLLCLPLVILSGCGTTSPATDNATTPTLTAQIAAKYEGDQLYQALGGQTGIAAIVETFLYRLADDDRVVRRFDPRQIDYVQKVLNEQVCMLSGGPCHYSGDSMVRVHKGMKITEAEYQAVVEDFSYALYRQDVPVPTQQQLLERMAQLHDGIVGL
ncbi:group I truncated hemoglobin [Phytohalomonas tamaricis]|uniref:group I truncated hemoglobin n=1 Tax=Phytohalomonas tamaricis TaxID=2081032 RepID=UPI000D0B8AA1|nr:group 1 truncated hemoglobin [Phytohalomonas tamaricis]